MAANQLIGALPFVTLDTGCTVTIEAINPLTGATVTGVVLSQVAFRTAGGAPSKRPDAHDPVFVYGGGNV